MTSPNYGGGRDVPKGDISPAYLVKWMTWGRGQKSQKMGEVICEWPLRSISSSTTFLFLESDLLAQSCELCHFFLSSLDNA